MLGKIIKYELKSTYQTFLAIMCFFLLVSIGIFVGVFLDSPFIAFGGLSIMMLAAFPIGILYLVIVIQRFGKSIYGPEGYLLNTLPMKESTLVLGKLIASLIWGLVTAIVAGICFFSLLFNLLVIDDMYPSMSVIFSELGRVIQTTGVFYWVLLVVMLLVGVINIVLHIYFSSAIGNLPRITKWNGLVSVIAFLVISFINYRIQLVVLPESSSQTDLYYLFSNGHIIKLIIFDGIFAVLYYLGTVGILKKKMSLR